jgi:hypothetical protein
MAFLKRAVKSDIRDVLSDIYFCRHRKLMSTQPRRRNGHA